VIDQVILTALQYATIEPPDGGASWPSGLWSREEVLSYLNQRQDRLLKNSLIEVKVSNPDVAFVAGDRQKALPADWARTVSAVWVGSDGTIRELQRVDSFEADHAIADWRISSGDPLFYMEFDSPNLTIEIGPAPLVPGEVLLLYVPVGAALTGNGVSLTVADELETAIKYGALADMFGKDGRAQDLSRSAYCETRFHMVVEAAKLILEGWA